ncbi:MAG: hypothetical protein PHU23_15420 [Dehalococcoidales bacterium]|nr:hypothetical protein [Dehalococcoidales bacterium]
MATSLITVKDVQEKSKDGSAWLEITDQENRIHRIFRRVQDNEGNWHDLSGKYEMLRNSENRKLRLTTEQKGRFTNVVDVEPVESAPPRGGGRTTEDREAECRLKTFTTAYAKDLAVAGKITPDAILGWSELFFRYLQGQVTVSDEELDEAMGKMMEAPSPAKASQRKSTAGREVSGVVS